MLMAMMWPLSAFGQDVIVKKDGSTVKAKVVEVTQTEIMYKKHSNQNGPLYHLAKSDVFSINYENGEVEKYESNINSANGQKNSNDEVKIIEDVASDKNKELISMYNQDNHYAQKVNQRKSHWRLNFVHVAEESTLQTSTIELSLGKNPPGVYEGAFSFKLINLTNDFLYIDLGNCFRINRDGSYDTYYKGEATTQTNTTGGSSGVSLNMGSLANVLGFGGVLGTIAGGLNVGGSSQNSSSVSKVKYQERFITIPPKGNYTINKGESFIYRNREKTPCRGEEFTYTVSDSPVKYDYIFTYSTDRSFTSCKIIKATCYLAKQMGVKDFDGDENEKYITNYDDHTIKEWDYLDW